MINNNYSNTAATYVAPTLKTSEILSCLNELQIQASITDLNNPTFEKTLYIYDQLYQLIFFSEDQINEESQLDKRYNIQSNHKELYTETIHLIKFYKKVKQMLNLVGYKNYHLNSFCEPKADQLKKTLSGIINFMKFKQQKMYIYEDFLNKTDELNEEIKEVRDKKEDLIERVNKKELSIKENESEKEEIQNHIKDYKENIKFVKEEFENESEKRMELKKIINLAQGELDDLEYKIKQLKLNIEEQETFVVKNPEKLKTDIESMESKSKSKADQLKESNAELMDKKKQKSKLETIVIEITHVLEMITDCNKEYEMYMKYNEDIQKLRELNDKTDIKKREKQMKLEQLERQIINQNDKIEKIKIMGKEKIEYYQAKLAKLNKKREEFNIENTKNKQRLKELVKNLRNINDKTTEIKNTIEMEIFHTENVLSELLTQVHNYIDHTLPVFETHLH